jgi:hypothetical protein
VELTGSATALNGGKMGKDKNIIIAMYKQYFFNNLLADCTNK